MRDNKRFLSGFLALALSAGLSHQAFAADAPPALGASKETPVVQPVKAEPAEKATIKDTTGVVAEPVTGESENHAPQAVPALDVDGETISSYTTLQSKKRLVQLQMEIEKIQSEREALKQEGEIAKLQSQHEAEIEALSARHETEITNLKAHYHDRVARVERAVERLRDHLADLDKREALFVLSTSGFAGNRQATFYLNGARVRRAEGEKIGARTLVAIERDGVRLENTRGETLFLTPVTEAEARAQDRGYADILEAIKQVDVRIVEYTPRPDERGAGRARQDFGQAVPVFGGAMPMGQ